MAQGLDDDTKLVLIEKWLKTDLELETNKVREWIENRIEVLDEEFRTGKK